eukprot:6461236-Amphidinium_carterae.1
MHTYGSTESAHCQKRGFADVYMMILRAGVRAVRKRGGYQVQCSQACMFPLRATANLPQARNYGNL